MLKSLFLATTLVAGAVGIASAMSPTDSFVLKPIQASTLDLGTTHGSAYYVQEANGFHVIATLDTGSAMPVRFGATLAIGQSATVSVPVAMGEAPLEITFTRIADRLEVRKSAPFDAVTASTR